MNLPTLLTDPDVQALGWALLHFVWQGAILAAIFFVADTLTRPSQARLRYTIGCIVMLLMPAVFVLTLLRPEFSQPQAFSVQTDSPVIITNPNATPRPAPLLTSPVAPPSYDAALVPGCIACLWLLGVTALSTYSALGWLRIRQLTRHGIEPLDPAWISTLDRLRHRLRITAPVRLCASAIAQVPTLIGWLRPCILLPVSALTGLDQRQLQAILAHELAHIRRQDYLINLLQNAVETLLFYHPAVWWISHRVREEREHCCDDLAVQCCGDVLLYAGALARLEEMRATGLSEPALAATGGNLLARIRRLLGEDSPRHIRVPPSFLLTLSAAVTLTAVMTLGGQSHRDAGAPSTFEVASVKINPSLGGNREPGPQSNQRYGSIEHSPDTLTLRKISMGLMLGWAYSVGSYQISGPDWVQRPLPPFYDVVAKSSTPATEGQLRRMLQSLLVERFHLAVHWQKKNMPVIALVIAKGGPKFHQSRGKFDPSLGPEAPFQFLGFDDSTHIQRALDHGRIRDSYTNMPMNVYASVLAMAASKTPYDKVPVVDMTGLPGRYDFSTLMDRPSGETLALDPHTGQILARMPDDPLTTGLRQILPQQLGLALESRAALVDVLVVDHIDQQPTPN